MWADFWNICLKRTDLEFTLSFTLSPSASFSFLFPPSFSSLEISASRVAMEGRRRGLVMMQGFYICLHMLVPHIVSMQALILQGEWKKFANFSMFLEIWDKEHRAFRILQDYMDSQIDCCWVHTPKGNSRKEHQLSLLLSNFFIRS